MKGIRNGVSIFLSTGYCIGTVLAMLLNAILPEDAGVDYGDGMDEEGNPIKAVEDGYPDKTMKMSSASKVAEQVVVPDDDFDEVDA